MKNAISARHMQVLKAAVLLAVSVNVLPLCADETSDRTLTIVTWEDYFSPDVLDAFAKANGVKVEVLSFEDDDELFAYLQDEPGKYDVAVVSDTVLTELVKLKLLASMDKAGMPNFRNMSARFLNRDYDPGNQFSIPYTWGTIGLGVNREHVSQASIADNSWSILWDPAFAGKVGLQASPSELLYDGLKVAGHSLNSADDADLQQAKEKLLALRSQSPRYLDPAAVRDQLASGEIWVAQIYSGDAAFAAGQNPQIAYVLPKEGGRLWIDNFCIPKSSKRQSLAQAFINYMLEPSASGQNTNYIRFANPSDGANAFILPEILKDPGVYPSEAALASYEFAASPSDASDTERRRRIMNETWAVLNQPQSPSE